MTANLPAYLQQSNLPRLSDRATDGMGSALPPHVSIRGNEFTLVNASGEEKSVETKHLDVCIIDMGDVMAKLYYDKDWSPDSKDPPICWSANGIGPSKEAINPQAPTCAQCPNNIRGSAQSKLTGASIKACRDEKWLAVTIVGIKDMIFQFRVTPGSFKNWTAFSEKFKKQPFDIRDVVTRLQFEKDKSGVVTFQPVEYINAEQAAMRNKLLGEKAADGIVGRLDSPITGLLVAPSAQQALPPAQPTAGVQAIPHSSAETPVKPARGRPKKPAEPAAEATPPANGGAMAPFRPEAAPTFGIQEAVQPPAEVANDLDAFFKS